MLTAEVAAEIAQLHAELEMLGRIEWWLNCQEKTVRQRLNALLDQDPPS